MRNLTAEELRADVVMSLVRSCGIDGPDAIRIRTEFAEAYDRTRSKEEEIAVLLSVVRRCADNRHPLAYLSVPLTTGREFIELHARQNSKPTDQERFRVDRSGTLAQNRSRAHQAAEKLRTTLSGMVIDPSRLVDIPDWEQADYHAFWSMVIEQYSEEVFFLEGWQYSVGCTIEFCTAVQLGLPIFTSKLAPLEVTAGRQLVQRAIDEYIAAGLDPEPLRAALSVAERPPTQYSRPSER